MATRWNQRNITIKIEEMQKKTVGLSHVNDYIDRTGKGRVKLNGFLSVYRLSSIGSGTLSPDGTMTVTTISGHKYFETFNNLPFTADGISKTIRNTTNAEKFGIVIDLTALGSLPNLFQRYFGKMTFVDLTDDDLLYFSDMYSTDSINTVNFEPEQSKAQKGNEAAAVYWDGTAVTALDREYTYDAVTVTWDMTAVTALDRS
jgi:hypothetical protein